MPIINALLAALLLVGLLGMLESVSRRFWAPMWVKRGFSSQWAHHKVTTVRIAASVTAALLAGISFDSIYAFTAFAALAWAASLAISTDLADMKIPSEPLWTVLWVALLAASAETVAEGNIAGNINGLTDMFIAEAVVLGTVFAAVLLSVGGIGSGDVRLLAALTVSTAWLGAGASIPALALAAVGYLVTRQALLRPASATGKSGRQSIPFAPGIVAGYALVAIATALLQLL